jgi:signal transduction histidine kinase
LSIAATGFALARGTNDVSKTPPAALLAKDAANASRVFAAGVPAAAIIRVSVLAPTLLDLSRISSSPVAVGVVDRTGRLLVADSCTYRPGQAVRLGPCAAEARRLFASLLRNEATRENVARAATSARLVQRSRARLSFVGVPILDTTESYALVAVFAGPLPSPKQSWWSRFWAQWRATVPQDAVWLIATTLLFGTLIGFLLSHRFVRRIHQLSATTAAWGHGDLTATAPEGRNDELGHLAHRLNQMAAQIRNLLETRAVVAAEEERHRVQRDLHDGIKQELFAASMELAAAKASLHTNPDVAAEALTHAHAACLRAQKELAQLLQDEPSPPDRDLNRALRELCARMATDTGVEVTYDGHDDVRLPMLTSEALFRITQEALANTRRHAAASHVNVRLSAHDSTVRLEIADDGHGFDTAHASQGMGLVSMRARVADLEGDLSLESGNAGTTIRITLPVE